MEKKTLRINLNNQNSRKSFFSLPVNTEPGHMRLPFTIQMDYK